MLDCINAEEGYPVYWQPKKHRMLQIVLWAIMIPGNVMTKKQLSASHVKDRALRKLQVAARERQNQLCAFQNPLESLLRGHLFALLQDY